MRHCAHADVGRVLSGRCSGTPLNAEGRAHARWLAGRFARGEPIAAIHSSPRLRTRETAAAIAERLKLPVTQVDALDEIDFGGWTGRSFAELDSDPAWHHWNAARAIAQTPGGETMRQAVMRAMAHLDRIAAQDWGGAVLCVTHCDIIRGIVAHILGLTLDRLLSFDIDPGSISSLLLGERERRVLTLNWRSE
ncbi:MULTISPECIES: histidine phosphatase family protein [unclassified Sphingomonas]|uniref:histidine phosphatase family protein n=1 Tax=unclassified Sphingomonas TaxID=196159 RepID=UPI001E3D7ABB|nr:MULTISPECIES: histidine phosphatase family protein [unclassified Sphingomonas]